MQDVEFPVHSRSRHFLQPRVPVLSEYLSRQVIDGVLGDWLPTDGQQPGSFCLAGLLGRGNFLGVPTHQVAKRVRGG